jgi:hypothetical protein
MSNLTGRPTIGQKIPKPPKAAKAVRKVSAKRAAYLASPERAAGKAHMAVAAALPCIACGAWPVEVHHEWDLSNPKSDMRVLPLCPMHHRREYGEQARHYASGRHFFAAYGSADELLGRVAKIIAAQAR